MPRSNTLVLACLFAAAFLIPATPAVAQTPQDVAWKRVLDQEAAAFQILNQELSASSPRQQQLQRERVTAFRETVARLADYRSTFIPDAASASEVNALFRMGFYMEFASWDSQALIFYKGCSTHPRLRDRNALFGNPERPLEPQVRDRIAAVEVRLKQNATSGSTVHSLSVLARYSGKGGIDLPGAGPAPEPLTSVQALEVSSRLSFPISLDRARQQWRALLDKQPALLPLSEDTSVPGMLVIGIKGSQENARLVASTLDTYWKELTDRYFNSATPGPTLVVFANFTPQAESYVSRNAGPANVANAAAVRPGEQRGAPTAQQSPAQQAPARNPVEQTAYPEQRSLVSSSSESPEQIARTLSRTIHFRDMASLEGYFQPLDNTLVLRKNLIGPQGHVFLGTGLHELVHALIHVDYPQAPMWLNEGLAALHEEYGTDGPHDNYRLYVAQAAIEARGRWPSLAQLFTAPAAWWNSDAHTVMAAASRYFCMYLWKEGLLPKVYQGLRDKPAGASTESVLQQITGWSMEQLQDQWLRDIASRDANALDARFGSVRGAVRNYISNLPEFGSIR